MNATLRVAIDARLGRHPSGIGHYVYNLAAAAGADDPQAFTPLCHYRQLSRFRRCGLAPRLARAEIDETLLRGIDVIHGPNFHAPCIAKVAPVATVHDLAFIHFPDLHPPGMPARLDRQIRQRLRSTARFICDSADTLEAFVEHYGVSHDLCDRVPLGVDQRIFHAEVDNTYERWLRVRHRLPRPFILFVGAMVPRKDLPTLLRAFAIVAGEFPEHDLAVAGHKTRRWASDWPKVRAWVQEHPEFRRRVRVLNYVSARDLPHLYRASDVVALPSITEGFGLTVLEAFATRKPIVATRGGAIPEVGRDAAFYATPGDAEEFAAGLSDALSGSGVPERLRRGTAIANEHSWARTWRLTRASYERASS